MDGNKSSKVSGPTLSAAGAREAEARRQRQAQALRANLARRKARDRARDDATGPPAAPAEPLETKAVSEPPPGKTGGA